MDSGFLSKISKVDFNRIEEMIAPTITDIIEVRRCRKRSDEASGRRATFIYSPTNVFHRFAQRFRRF
jgi:hypothetical protein